MQKILVTGLFIFYSLQSYTKFTTSVIDSVGMNLTKNLPIQADCYETSSQIFNFYIDSSSHNITLFGKLVTKKGKQRSIGEILVYNIKDQKIKWIKPIDYTNKTFTQDNDILIESGTDVSNQIILANGQNKWEYSHPCLVYYVDTKQNIGLGYRKDLHDQPRKLVGVNLETNEVLWKYGLDQRFGSLIQKYDENSVIILASGIHKLDLKTGEGWSHPLKTGFNSPRKALASNLLMAAVSVSTFVLSQGTYISFYYGFHRYSGFSSNLIVNKNEIVIATKERLIRVNSSGTILNDIELPSKKTSSSSIFIRDNVLYMINYGFLLSEENLVPHGVPFFTAFDLMSNSQLFYYENNLTDNHYNTFRINGENIDLVYNGHVARYSDFTTKSISESIIEFDTTYDYLANTEKSFYVLSNESLVTPLESFNQSSNYFVTDSNKIVDFSGDYRESSILDREVFQKLSSNDHVSVLRYEEVSIIINNMDEIIGRLYLSENATIYENKILDTQENKLIQIDLNQFIK